MCSTQKSINISERSSNQSQTNCLDLKINIIEVNENKISINGQKIQTLNDHAEVIRSNKTIMKRNLRNSIQIPKTISFLNTKEDKLTAASLKDLNSDEQQALKTTTLQNCRRDAKYASSKTFTGETQEIIAEIFNQKYQVIKKIGQGAHSTIYKCLNKIDNNYYALKKIKNVSFENCKKIKNMFRMMKSLCHQNVIKYYDFYLNSEKKTAYIFMEYCGFNDLRCELSKRSLAGNGFQTKQIQSIIKKVLDVLKYLHKQGICHRDLKPENVLYNKQTGQIKVIDLDVCGVKKSKKQSFDLWTNTGTLFYRAPETFGVGYTQKADIWSLGVMIYELITGKTPFQTQYEKDYVQNLNRSQLSLQAVQTSQRIKQFLRLSLQKNPQLRSSAISLTNLILSKPSDDSVMSQRIIENHHTNFFTNYQDSDVSKICLGNLLKFTYF